MLTDEEEQNLNSVANQLGLEPIIDRNQEVKVRLVQAKVLRDVMSGEPRQRIAFDGALPFMLSVGEIPLWAFPNVDCYETKTQRHFEGGSHGASIRIMKGVYYRVGAFKGHPVEVQVTEKTDRGLLVVTNKNIFFGGLKHLKIPIKKLVSLEPHSDGIKLQKDGVRAKPIAFTPVDGWFAYNLISNLQLA